MGPRRKRRIEPEGGLTPVQYGIMEAVWAAGDDGATVKEIWEDVSDERDVARTTILNLVDRLCTRGWLRRLEGTGTQRFQGTLGRDDTKARLADGFLADFFGGSASQLVMSLLGSKAIEADELREIEELIEGAGKRGGRAKRRGTR